MVLCFNLSDQIMQLNGLSSNDVEVKYSHGWLSSEGPHMSRVPKLHMHVSADARNWRGIVL